MQLPDMDGITALGKIKAMAPEKRVIIMTGFSTKDVAIHALTARADNYIEKPFELQAMRAAIEKELSFNRTCPACSATDSDGKVAHARRFLEANALGKVTLEDAAKAVFLAPKYLSRLFRQKTGMSFSQYKLKIKMDLARRLLVSSGDSIKQISLKLGYANAVSFIRQFENIVKTRPSSYRSRGRKRS